MNYLQFDFETSDLLSADILVAVLSASNFDGFEESDQLLKAFVAEEEFDEAVISDLQLLFPSLVYKRTVVKNINWNAEWEANFLPVLIDDYVGIRAHFHQPLQNVCHEIIITPKMSFGTGHHSTTFMMVQLMRDINFKAKSVIDFGTGTGVLAILAALSGAQKVVAIDNDAWSIENAEENFSKNEVTGIQLLLAETLPSENSFDVVLANINLNIIVSNIEAIAKAVKNDGVLLLSGFLPGDLPAVKEVLNENNLSFSTSIQHNNWLAVRATKHQEQY